MVQTTPKQTKIVCFCCPCTRVKDFWDEDGRPFNRDDSLMLYNSGEAVPPGWVPTDKCIAVCYIPATGLACCDRTVRSESFSGIPIDTPKVPPQEEKEILARWQGHWQIKHDKKLAAQQHFEDFPGDCFAAEYKWPYTDAHIDGNVLTLSGGDRLVSERTDHESMAYVKSRKRNPRKRIRLSLWRGANGVLYIDNVGSTVQAETATELKIKAAIGKVSRTLTRDAPPTGAVMDRDGSVAL